MKQLKSVIMFCAILFSAALLSCAKKAVATVTKSDTNATVKTSRYNEDLSAVRPKFAPVTAANKEVKIKNTNKPIPKTAEKGTLEITDKLNIVLDSIAIHNRVIKSAPGYRVQIYVGESRDEALQARNKSYSLFPDETPYLIPTLPSYRVRVGDFMDRLEAQKVYKTLVKEFPNALVVADKIEIKKLSGQAEDK